MENNEIYKLIERKDFDTLEKIINEDDDKAKLVFTLLKEYNLFSLFYNRLTVDKSKTKTIIIKIKQNIMEFVNANFTINLLNLADTRRGKDDKNIEKIETEFFNIIPFDDKLLISFVEYYKNLKIIKDNQLILESEKYKEKEIELDNGNYLIVIDNDEFNIKII